MGGLPSTPLPLGLAGLVIAKPASILFTGGQRNVSRGAGANLAVGSPPISAPAPSLQGDPEELPHPRRQVEGGNAAGHAQHTRGPSQGWGSQR